MDVLGPIERISKGTFVNVLSQVCLSETNINNGYRATGIFPSNRVKYNIKHFDQQPISFGLSQGDQRTLMQKMKQTMTMITSNS